MIRKLLSFSKKIVLAFAVFGCVFAIAKTQAAPNIFGNDGTGRSLTTERVAGGAGYNTAVSDTTLAETVGQIIGVILSVIGTLFFVLLFYAGYLWFMARGDEGEIEKAQSIIKTAVIGLVITLSAYTISVFVVEMIGGATGEDNRVGESNPTGGGIETGSGTGESEESKRCRDKVQNYSETDVDCGGGVCPACANYKGCVGDRDCQSGDCFEGACIRSGASGTCEEDGKQNGEETDTDCGGTFCPACGSGRKCKANSDCVAGVKCNTGICGGGPTCFDDTQNGNETDKDCGGGTCNKCEANEKCKVNNDCRSGNCSSGLCKI